MSETTICIQKLKIAALAKHLNMRQEEIQKVRENCYAANQSEYLVLSDDEAEAEFEMLVARYSDENIFNEVRERSGPGWTFDKWTRIVNCETSRGSALANYDGCEIEHDGFYIYRIT